MSDSSAVEKHPLRRTIASALLITLLTVLLVAVVAVLLDNRCYSALRAEDIPRYPNGVLVTDSHQFLGSSRLIYETPDTPGTVEAWYRQEITRILRAGVEAGNPVGAPSWAGLYAVQLADDGHTQIVFSASCP